MKVVKETVEFDWDLGNIEKNELKHGVIRKEAEEVFLKHMKIVIKDEKHSLAEDRYLLLGKTFKGRKLSVVYTMRGNKIRIISARDMNKKERRLYEEKEIQKNPNV